MADKLGSCRLKKGVPYPVARVGGPREKWDTLAEGNGGELFSGVGVSTLPEAAHNSNQDAGRRSSESALSSGREGDPCSNKFLFSLYEGAMLMLLAEGKPLGSMGAPEAACSALVGFVRCFSRAFPEAETVEDVRRLLNRSVMTAHEECSRGNTRYSATLTAVAIVRLQRAASDDTEDNWAVVGVSIGEAKAFLLRKDGQRIEDLTKGNVVRTNPEVGFLGQSSTAGTSFDLPNLTGLVTFSSHAAVGDQVFLASYAAHANFHPAPMGLTTEAFCGVDSSDWSAVDTSSSSLLEKLDEHYSTTVKSVLLHKRKSLSGITPSKLSARLAKHIRSSTSSARKARAVHKEVTDDLTVLGHATIAACRIAEVTCATFEPVPNVKHNTYDEYRYDAVLIGEEFDAWKKIAELSPGLAEGLESLTENDVKELHLHVGVSGVSVKKAGPTTLSLLVKTDEEDSSKAAKWRAGATVELKKGSSRANLRNLLVDAMRDSGLDAQTTMRAAESLVAGTEKCAVLQGRSKSLSFSQFGEPFHILLGDLEVEQVIGTITHGRGDTAEVEKCIVLRLVGSKLNALEGFLTKLELPAVARETVPRS